MKPRAELMNELMLALRDANAQSVLYSQAVASRIGISSSDLECLDVIVLRGPITAGGIAAATGLTGGAVTGLIDRLEQAKLVRREHDPDDRRKVMVRALPAVEQRIDPLFEPIVRSSSAAMARYTDEQLALILDFVAHASEGMRTAMEELKTLTANPKAKRGKAGTPKP
ncbi:MAG: MarR family winged helix-turn-helix transcriptional regulator [Pseudomonadota bacterium]|jgi:DNA-binding MarR family transcriptional regulator